jgi:hypothetical protein
VSAERVRHAQASTEVMRVLDTVKNQYQRRLAYRFKNFVKIVRLGPGIDQRHDALMATAAGNPVELFTAGSANHQALLSCGVQQALQTGIAPVLIDQ